MGTTGARATSSAQPRGAGEAGGQRSNDVVDVLIIGAGPAGLTVAAELQRANVPFRIVDRLQNKVTYSQASVVHSRVQELLYFTGALDRVRSKGHKMRPQETTAFGRRLGMMQFGGLNAPYDAPWIVGQDHVERSIAAHIEQGGATIERGKAASGLVQDADGVFVTLDCADGTKETIRARYVVGADGSRSAIRDLIGVGFSGKKYNDEFQFLVADIHMPPTFPTEHGYTIIAPDGAILLIIPQEGTHRIVLSRPKTGEELQDPLTLEEVQRLVSIYGPKDAIVSDPIWLSPFGTHRRIADHLVEGRVVIVGDAAHQHVPLGGQGMNTGVSDAFNLGWKLAMIAKGEAGPGFLKSYQAERMPVAQALVDSTDRIFEAFSKAPLPLRLWMRNIVPLVFNRKFVQDRARYAVSQLKISYGKNGFVGGHKPRKGPAPGQRAEDAIVFRPDNGREQRLFELFTSAEHNLLLFSGTKPARGRDRALAIAANDARSLPIPVTVSVIALDRSFPNPEAWDGNAFRDFDAEVNRLYGVGSDGEAVLVRPDGYVAWRGSLEELGACRRSIAQAYDVAETHA